MADAATEQRAPTPGRIVLYKLQSGHHRGEYRPAIIVKVWAEPGQEHPDVACQLQVFADGNGDPDTNDGLPNVFWQTSRSHGDYFGSWIWPDELGQGHPHHAASAEGAE